MQHMEWRNEKTENLLLDTVKKHVSYFFSHVKEVGNTICNFFEKINDFHVRKS